MAAVESEIPRCASRLNLENVDCVLWALASLQTPLKTEAMSSLTTAAARLGDRMDAEMLVKTHWAFARLRHRPDPGDMNLIVSAAKRLVGELPDEDRLTVMHAWGVLRVNPGKYFPINTFRLPDCPYKTDISFTHWAFARLRHRPDPGDMNLIVSAAKRLVGELPDEDRLTVMHAWGVLRVNPGKYFPINTFRLPDCPYKTDISFTISGDDVVREFTKTFRSGEDDQSTDGGEKSLDGASCAKLLCAYGRTRHQPPPVHALRLAQRLVEEAENDVLHPSAATLGLWGASLLGLKMSSAQLDVLARDAVSQDTKLAPRSLAKIVWALAALGYDPTAADLAKLRTRSASAFPRLAAKDQEALREALSRLGERDLDFVGNAA